MSGVSNGVLRFSPIGYKRFVFNVEFKMADWVRFARRDPAPRPVNP